MVISVRRANNDGRTPAELLPFAGRPKNETGQMADENYCVSGLTSEIPIAFLTV